ncbi:hypothetical protein EV384_3000 [Micromonospora kangleipakensis]|uniref:Uncharacterized protein n=2 Tax=Micromonospora kangleipakensis TaxID=1077942 RepID=A0A4Q8BAG2_9ACTN|nr:hypothetical protein EV384_3000 [Micromonospora kangleipakensis]
MWWVARWTARMLASLAVVVACSLGAATLPVGAAAAAQAAPVEAFTPAAPEASRSAAAPALRVGARAVPEPDDQSGAAGPALIGAAALDPGRVTNGSAVLDAGRVMPGATADRGRAVRGSVGAAGGDLVAGTGQQAQPVGVGSPAAAPRAVIVAAAADRAPGGTVPAALGSRAPPAR